MDVIAITIHTIVGSLASCDATFASAASQVSAHYGVGLEGEIHQYVSLDDAAWANGVLEPDNRWPFGNGNPNFRVIAIETEDRGQPDSQPVTDAQYAGVLACCALAREAWPGVTHLVAHRAISPQSRSCPGARWIDSGRFAQLADELGLTPIT